MWEGKPSQNENEYFARRDAEWLKEQRARLDAERAARSKAINCPRCTTPLTQRSFAHVTVDSCPKCHGVWFDGGELAMLAHEPEKELLRLARELEGGG
jgi:hypothetical protein